MFMVVSWSIIVRMVVVIIKLWVSLMTVMILNHRFFMVMNMGHNWRVMSGVVFIVVLVMVKVLIMMVIVMVDMLVVRSLVMLDMLNVVVDWLVVDNFMVHFMMDWLVVYLMVWGFMVYLMVWDLMVIFLVVYWGMVHFMCINMVWNIMVSIIHMTGLVDIVYMAWLKVGFMVTPCIMMITWVVILMVANFMMIVMSPGVMMSWLVVPVTVDIVMISPSTIMLIMFSMIVVFSMMVVMLIMVVPGKITVVMMRNIPVALIVTLIMMVDVMWLVVVMVVELMMGLVVSWIHHMVRLLVVMGVMMVIRVISSMVVVMLDNVVSWVVVMGIPMGVMVLSGMWIKEIEMSIVFMSAISYIVVYIVVYFSMYWGMNWSMMFWSMCNWVCVNMCSSMSRMEWNCMGWRSVHWCMNWNMCNWVWCDVWGLMVHNWVSGCVYIVTITKVGINTICICVTSMVSWCSVMILSSVVVSVMRLVVGFMSMSVCIMMASIPIIMTVMWGIVTMCGMQFTVTVSIMMSISVMVIMVIHWLHFQDQVTARCVHIGWIENRRVSFKSTRCLMPSSAIKGIKIVSPVKDEITGLFVICEDFNVVVKHVPWHVDWVETISPRVESWSPEVHSQRLSFVHKCNRGIIVWNVADFHAIDCPADVVWCP